MHKKTYYAIFGIKINFDEFNKTYKCDCGKAIKNNEDMFCSKCGASLPKDRCVYDNRYSDEFDEYLDKVAGQYDFDHIILEDGYIYIGYFDDSETIYPNEGIPINQNIFERFRMFEESVKIGKHDVELFLISE